MSYPLQNPVRKSFVFFLLYYTLFFIPADTLGQSVKKCFENASAEYSNKMYRSAIYWYTTGMEKGRESDVVNGRKGLANVMPAYYLEKLAEMSRLSSIDAAESIILPRLDEIDSIHRVLSNYKFTSVPKGTGEKDFMWSTTETSALAKVVRSIGINTIAQPGEGSLASFDTFNYFYARVTSYLFISRNKKAFENEVWSADLKSAYENISGKSIKANCDELSGAIEVALLDYASKNYRKAANNLWDNLEKNKDTPREKCDAIRQGSDLLEKIIAEGQAQIIVMTVKSSQGEFSSLSAQLTAHLNTDRDPLLKAIPQQQYENELFKHEIDIDELRNLNAVVLGKLNKSLNIRYMVIPRVVNLREGQPQYQRTTATAYEVWYEEETTSSGTKVKKWYTKGSASYQQVVAKKVWDVAIEFKIYDVVSKSIVYNKTLNFNHTSSVDYYEGIDPESYSNQQLPYSQRRSVLSGLNTGSDTWRANFYRNNQFTDADAVYKEFEHKLVKEMPQIIYKTLREL